MPYLKGVGMADGSENTRLIVPSFELSSLNGRFSVDVDGADHARFSNNHKITLKHARQASGATIPRATAHLAASCHV